MPTPDNLQKEPPVSQKLLKKFVENVLTKTQNNLNVTLVGFRGSGLTSPLKYLMQNYKDLDIYGKNHLFTIFDLNTVLDSEDKAYRQCLLWLKNNSKDQLDYNVLEKIDEMLALKQILNGSFNDIFHNITYSGNSSITFLIDNSRLIYEGTNRHEELRTIVNTLRKINPMKISLIFMADSEFDDSAAEFLKDLSLSFIQNILWGKEFLFDRESGNKLFENQQIWHNHTYNEKFKEKAILLSSGDPTILKHIATKALSDDEFENLFLKEEKIENIYKMLDRAFLDLRFTTIIKLLETGSINSLQNNYAEPTDFLINTGLVKKEGSSFLPINRLFDYFVKNNLKNMRSWSKSVNITGEEIKKSLSGQELMIFELFESKEDVLITKDQIAKVLWGDEWEQKFSDWAIDKLVSNIRKKLTEGQYPKTIKSFKGKGFKYI